VSSNKRPVKYAIPDRLNLIITLVQVAASLALLAVASWAWNADQMLWLGLAALLFSLVMQTGFSLLHEAEHRKLHSNRKINDGLGFICATMFPGSYQLMTVAHLNHHKVNRSDAELVDYIRPGESALLKSVQYYSFITGLIWLAAPLMTLFICLTPSSLLARAFAKGEDHWLSRYLAFTQSCGAGKARQETCIGLLLWVGAWLALGLNWQAVAMCYAAFAFSWSSQQYVYHVRTPRHLIEGAYDLKLWWPVQWLYLHFNFHLSHHRATNVPWLHMPKLVQSEPTQGYLATYLKLWAPPQPVERAWPVDHQTRGPLVPQPVA
jgi:fatty acid desaturase